MFLLFQVSVLDSIQGSVTSYLGNLLDDWKLVGQVLEGEWLSVEPNWEWILGEDIVKQILQQYQFGWKRLKSIVNLN